MLWKIRNPRLIQTALWQALSQDQQVYKPHRVKYVSVESSKHCFIDFQNYHQGVQSFSKVLPSWHDTCPLTEQNISHQAFQVGLVLPNTTHRKSCYLSCFFIFLELATWGSEVSLIHVALLIDNVLYPLSRTPLKGS